MAVLDQLEPKEVFRFFEELCAIPHGSRRTEKAADWCVAFARERGLDCRRDQAGNVIIFKEASPGYEAAEAVILQGHLDMVCEKAAGCPKDMDREGLDLALEGDYLYAKDTTLGGDDGIAVAMILALLDSDEIPHPRLEAVLTADEEIGMLGAEALDASSLKGRRMINLDSEEEGVFTVSCAGGCMARCVLPLRREAFPGTALALRISGPTGGHSGAEIHKERANANVLLGRLLSAVSRATDLRLLSVRGGLKDNAIPVSAEAAFLAADPQAARRAAEVLAADLRREYGDTDPGLAVKVSSAEAEGLPMDKDATDRTLCLLTCAPDGVQAMSRDIPGLVQTSLNLGILETGETDLAAVFCVRSSLASQKAMLRDRLVRLTERLGGRTEISGDYPAWEYRRDSRLRELMTEVFREQYGREPKVEAIHAGLECGLFCGKLPGLDCVSAGPDILEIHTPRERLSVPSVRRVWVFLLEVLRRLQ